MKKLKEMIKIPFSKNNLLYTILFLFVLCVIIINRSINGFENIIWIADIGSFFGVLGSIFRAKHYLIGFIFNLFLFTILIITTYLQQVYFSFAVAIFYFVMTTVTIINWERNKKTDVRKNVKSLSKKQWMIFSSIYVAILPVIMIILWKLGSNLFYLDAFVSSALIVGVILISNLYYEAFYFLIANNILAIIMYSILSFQNINNLSVIAMTLCYLITAMLALINWRKLFLKQQNEIIKK